MTEIIIWNLITLNGFYNGTEDWQIDWHNQVWGEELEQFSIQQFEEIDCLIFGRKTYEGMADYWQNAEGQVADLMNAIPKMVFSKTLEKVTWNNTELIKEDVVTYINRMVNAKSDNTDKMFIFGSGELVSALHDARLIDEYRLCISPVILGKGKPMFKPSDNDMNLTLQKAKVLQSGGIIMWLTPKSE